MGELDWKIQIFLVVSVCYTIYRLIMYVFREKDIELTEFKRYVLGWIVVIVVVGFYWHYTKSNMIKDGGLYYVNMFEKVDSQKNYRVPAVIFTGEDGYSLGTVYWSNGGELNFDSNEDLIIGEKIPLNDYDGKEWFIELTNKKAELKE